MQLMQRPTKRQRLKRALACQRLGLESPDSALLEVERGVPGGHPEAQGTALLAPAQPTQCNSETCFVTVPSSKICQLRPQELASLRAIF